MSVLLFKKVWCYAILFSVLISGLLLHPGFLSSMEKSVLLDRVFRVNKTSPRTLFTYSDPENNDLDFEVYVVFDKRKGLIKIGFNPKIGMNINLIEKIGEIGTGNINSYVNRSFTARSEKLICIATIKNYKKYLLSKNPDVKGHQYRLKWLDIHVEVERIKKTPGR